MTTSSAQGAPQTREERLRAVYDALEAAIAPVCAQVTKLPNHVALLLLEEAAGDYVLSALLPNVYRGLNNAKGETFGLLGTPLRTAVLSLLQKRYPIAASELAAIPGPAIVIIDSADAAAFPVTGAK